MLGFNIMEILLRLPVLCLVFTVHEFAHGYMAYKLGDETAKRDGRLSFNPLKHIDPIGMLCLLLFRFGWAKPVMVNPSNLRNPKIDMAYISVAGPVSNILFAFLVGLIWVPVSTVVVSPLVAGLVNELILLNIVLAVFNMLPIPPLDGSKVFTVFLSEDSYFRFQDTVGRYGFLILIVLIWTGITQQIIFPVVNALYVGMFEVLTAMYNAMGFLPVVLI